MSMGALREEVRDMAGLCQDNKLSLNVSKINELIVDYIFERGEHAPIHIDRTVVEQDERFKFLGVDITKGLTWTTQSRKCHGSASSLSGGWKDLAWAFWILKVLQLHHQVHLDWLHHRLVWQMHHP
jgi:hypothetical protein